MYDVWNENQQGFCIYNWILKRTAQNLSFWLKILLILFHLGVSHYKMGLILLPSSIIRSIQRVKEVFSGVLKEIQRQTERHMSWFLVGCWLSLAKLWIPLHICRKCSVKCHVGEDFSWCNIVCICVFLFDFCWILLARNGNQGFLFFCERGIQWTQVTLYPKNIHKENNRVCFVYDSWRDCCFTILFVRYYVWNAVDWIRYFKKYQHIMSLWPIG